MILSIIIPARNEFPNIVHTTYSIINCLEADGFSYKDFEIIIVNNCSTDNKYPQRATGGTTDYLITRGAYYNRIIKVLYDPIAGNHSARNKGAEIAKGEYVFFSDAHMSYAPHFFSYMLKACQESKGLTHGAVAWLGAYPPTPKSLGYGYSLKLGEEIKGTWNNYKIADSWFYVPAQGHWGVMANRKQFLEFGGYPKIHRTYGGGEFYTDIKWWLFGSCVVVEPRAIGYHLASGRGYSYHHNDYIHNVFNIGFSLNMYDWTERFYINCLRKYPKDIIDKMYDEAYNETIDDQKFIKENRKLTFNDLLIQRLWDKFNLQKHNYCHSGLVIYHDTWLKLLEQAPDYVKQAYQNSKYQKDLDNFIRQHLSKFIYNERQPTP